MAMALMQCAMAKGHTVARLSLTRWMPRPPALVEKAVGSEGESDQLSAPRGSLNNPDHILN
jgi:hypothetical protein